MPKHTVVWLDQHEARVTEVRADSFVESTVQSPAAHLHRHPKGASEAKHHPNDAKQFFDQVAHALVSADEVLLVGPGTAKLHFIKFAHEHARVLAEKIVGVETVDHPTDAQLAAYARKYFLAADRMR